MIVGIPRAMLFYRYNILWQAFFSGLGVNILISPETNKEILENGIKFSVDESCLPAKIFMGHVHFLLGKCDCILIPCIENYGANDKLCVKFNALSDIVKNTFKADILDYHVNIKEGLTEKKAFIKMGKSLGFSFFKTNKAYKNACIIYEKHLQEQNQKANELISQDNGKSKILVVAHPYIMEDKFAGLLVTKLITDFGGEPVPAHLFDRSKSLIASQSLSRSLYWHHSKELIGALQLNLTNIDGIVFLTAFPCGPDSLVNELMMRKIKNIPKINIILDELQSQAGLETRIESFMDIINQNTNDKLRMKNY